MFKDVHILNIHAALQYGNNEKQYYYDFTI